ncbi:type II secretion system secretin GspD [Agrobacterium vitis]|uniref:type II secretion system secretin GspD n=1 Tax=Agrobacterium vitis TaxID=373 RepID=UPI003D2AA9BD
MDIKSVVFSLSAVLLFGCASENSNDRWDSLMEGVGTDGRQHTVIASKSAPILPSNGGQSVSGFAVPGTGQFTTAQQPGVVEETTSGGGQSYTINLVNAPVAQASKRVLGDIMGYTYVIDPNVSGNVTVQTSEPVDKKSLLNIFEVALSMNNAALVQKNGQYAIVPSSSALSNTSVMSGSASTKGPGTKMEVIQLKYISADDMKDIIEKTGRPNAVLRTDPERNYIIVAGDGSELSALRDTIGVFDVDWMKGMSTAIYPLKTSKPQDVAKELTSVFGAGDGPNGKVIRFIPNSRLNAVLVITSRPAYLSKIQAWIAKLDAVAQNNDEQLFVYQIQNRSASELAEVLQNVINQKGKGAESKSNVAPNLAATADTATSLATTNGDMLAEVAGMSTESVPKIVADNQNNSLLISTTPRQYKRIEQILRQVDVMPVQVFLEAIIAEVTLNDQLQFGIRWYLDHGANGVGFSDLASGAASAAYPGFAWTHISGDVQTALNALSTVTKVKVISSPSLMVINNQAATLQVGDQVPTITQSSTSTTSANSAIVNSVELKDTGIILAVTPRINTSGRVTLDIKQEASNVTQTTTSGIDSPTIQQRKISTRVVVSDGESIALGGLIQERKSIADKKVPVFGDIPVLGSAFKSKTDTISRTELVIFIRPRIVQDVQQARDITAEFRGQFERGQSQTNGQRMRQDIKRIAQ